MASPDEEASVLEEEAVALAAGAMVRIIARDRRTRYQRKEKNKRKRVSSAELGSTEGM
ncbi:hypothetical protein BDZ94DRAFT_1275334 [Collybia nuda]|uniref:Uncharacterized protein n=1 Tax=Collybia nuda TaxID=64659 RepID=A0A9P5XVP1_9AGAR|nr:hypothetical protein BDZ94DRAFT_1275334 [Collybia nuda]